MGALATAMVAAVRQRIADQGATNIKTDTTLYRFLSEGQRRLAEDLSDAALYPLAKIDSTVIQAAVAAYDLPADFLRENLVLYKGIRSRRWETVDEDALRRNAQLTPSETVPFHIIWGNQVRFPRIVPTQTGAETIEVWYYCIPPEISASQEPLLLVPYHNTIETFAVARCFEMWEDYDVAAIEQAHYLEECLLINSRYSGKVAFDGVPNDPRLEILAGGQ